MIGFDLAFEATLGLACATWARGAPELRARRCFTDGLLLTAGVYVPFAVVGTVAWPAWQTHYAVDLDDPAWLAVAAGLSSAALVAAYVAGFAAGARGAGSGRQRAVLLAVGWAALLVLLFVVQGRRALTVASYEAFHAGASGGLIGGPLSAFLALAALVNGLGIAVVASRALGGRGA